MVPKAQHSPAFASEIGVATFVAHILGVLGTVGFDDQTRTDAKEVDDIGSDRDLPAKLEIAKTPVAQQSPKAKLGLGRRAAP